MSNQNANEFFRKQATRCRKIFFRFPRKVGAPKLQDCPAITKATQNNHGLEKLNGHFDLDTLFIVLRFISNAQKLAFRHLKIWPLVRVSETMIN